MADGSPLISVVVPAYNEAEFIGISIAHVRSAFDANRQLSGNYEIIVCDNNSTDGTASLALGLGCRVIFEEINQIGRARNTGATIAAGKWLLFVDADSWPSPELIDDMSAILQGDAYIGCGSTIRIVDGPWWFRRAWESKNLSMRILKWCPGGFILCRKDAFDALGGFDLAQYIFEEADFIARLKKLARRRKQKFVVLHKHPFSASGRKGSQYGLLSWMGTALRFWISPKKLARDKSFAGKWYDAGR